MPSRLGHVLSSDDVHNERHEAVRWSLIGIWAAFGGIEHKKDLTRGLGDTLPVRLLGGRSLDLWLELNVGLSTLKLSFELGGRFNFFELHGCELDDKSKGLFVISGGLFVLVLFIYVSNWLTLPVLAVRTMFSSACVDDMSTNGENNGRLATEGTEDELNELKPKLENNEFWASVAFKICLRSMSFVSLVLADRWQDEFKTFGGELPPVTRLAKGDAELVLNDENLGSPNAPEKPFFGEL